MIKLARVILLALAPVSIATAPLAPGPATLPPVDQCKSDAGFTKFRDKLKQAVEKRDRRLLLGLMAPDIFLDFDGTAGRAELVERWSFDPTEHGNIWGQLGAMLKLGCANSGGVRVIPSLSIQLDKYGADETFVMRLVLPGARLFKEPGNARTATPVAPWSLGTATNSGGDLWTGVRLADGREGLISDDRLYEALGYRMTIEKRRGDWQITAFVGGD